MSTKDPLVSVIMPAYNAEEYIAASITSIVQQTYKNWELIVINDGSTDSTPEVVSTFSSNDPRIKFIDKKTNKGIVATRNTGLQLASGKYIANLDSDDIAAKNRLTEQVDFLEKNTEFVLLGSGCEIINGQGEVTASIKRKIPNENISSLLLFSNYFINSSTMMRAVHAKKIGYNEDTPLSEDYQLFVALSKEGKIANLNKPLVQYRIHDQNISKMKEQELQDANRFIQKLQIEQLNYSPSIRELDMHSKLVEGNYQTGNFTLTEVESWLLKLVDLNQSERAYEERILQYYCAFFFRRACENTAPKLKPVQRFRKSPLAKYIITDIKGNSAFFVKTILKRL